MVFFNRKMSSNYCHAFVPVFNANKEIKILLLSNTVLIQKKKERLQSNIFTNIFCEKRLKSKKTTLFSSFSENTLDTIQKKFKQEHQIVSKTVINPFLLAALSLVGIFIFSFRQIFLKNKYILALFLVLSSGVFFLSTKKKNQINIKNEMLNAFSLQQKDVLKKTILYTATHFKLNSQNIKKEISEIYKTYLLVFLQNYTPKLDEIEELIRVKNFFDISNEEIGEYHNQIAIDLHKQYRIELERNPSEHLFKKIEKFLFLSDRVFSTDSEKGRKYEMTRLRKIFSLSDEKVSSYSSAISYSIYSEIIESLFKNDQWNLDNLELIQATVGIGEYDKNKIHLFFLKNFLIELISTEKKISSENQKKIELIKMLFKINEKDFQNLWIDLVKPFFSSGITEHATQCIKSLNEENIQEIAEFLIKKKRDFFLSSSELINFFLYELKKILQNTLNSTLKTHMQNKSIMLEIEKILNVYQNAKKISRVLSQLDQNINMHDDMLFYEIKQDFDFLKIVEIFEYFIKNCFENISILPEKQKNISTLKQIFSISEEKYKEIYNKEAQPLFEKKIVDSIESKKFTIEEVDFLKKFQFSLKLNEKEALDVKVRVYKNYLYNVMDKKKNISQENKIKLNKIKNLLLLRWNDIQIFYNEINDLLYKKAISEAMGVAGFISIDYWKKLEKLRKNLKITEKKARCIFYQVCKDKAEYIFGQIVTQYKKKNQPNGESKEERRSDITPSEAFLQIETSTSNKHELSDLIDFYSRNKIFVKEKLLSDLVLQKKMKNLNGRLELQHDLTSNFKYSYPVDLSNSFDNKVVLEIYKQYLTEYFSLKTQNEKKYIQNDFDKLAFILGIQQADVVSIHTDVGSGIYTQFLARALHKGFIDESEMHFLSKVKNILYMEDSVCLNLIKQAKKNKVKTLIEDILDDQVINAEKIVEMRKIALALNVNLQNDISVPIDQRVKLFKMEIDFNIEKEILNNENQNLIEELRFFFGLSKELTKKVLIENITLKCEECLINAIASIRRKEDEQTMEELKKIFKFGKILPVKIRSSFISAKEKEQIFVVFESLNRSDDDRHLLKTMLNL
nr:plastid import machinery, IAP100 protein [Cryptomonas paramecium]